MKSNKDKQKKDPKSDKKSSENNIPEKKVLKRNEELAKMLTHIQRKKKHLLLQLLPPDPHI